MNVLTKSIRTYVRNLHDRSFRVEEKVVLVEGKNAIDQAFRASRGCKFLVKSNDFIYRVPISVPVYDAESKDMDFISSTKTSYGIVGVFEVPVFRAGTGSFLVCDGIQDPGNLGSLIRSATAFGIKNVLCVGNGVDPFSPKAIRSSAGYVFDVHCAYGSFPDFISFFPKDVQIVGTDLSNSAISVWDMDVEEPYVLVIGSEGNGISPEIMKYVTKNIRIPMEESAESLNAAIAGSIIMSHLYGRKHGNNCEKNFRK